LVGVGTINVLENPDELWESGHLVIPEMRAGDLLFFMGAGMTHGADSWRADEDRCAILMNVWGPNMMRGRRPVVGPRL
jgi:ectoine hydroxylase-related dioxygenase (phytanoyl-CoA dioxygenase family)